MRNIPLILVLIICVFSNAIYSCNGIKRKGHEAIDKTKEVVKEKKEQLADKMFPEFDPGTPDTKYNKKRFAEFFSFEPTPDVKNIYCYADQIGIDASYWFNFECADSTIQKIITTLQLKPDKSYYTYADLSHAKIDTVFINDNKFQGGLNAQPTSWWDTSFIQNHTPEGKVKGNIYRYLWFNKSAHKAYFLMFDT